MAVKLFPTNDIFAIINYMVQDITGGTNATRVIDTSSFIDAGQTLLDYPVENVMNSLMVPIARTLIAVRRYSGKFNIISAIGSDVFSNRLQKISFYADESKPEGAFNTDLYPENLAEGRGNGQEFDDGTAVSTKSMWEQHRLTPLQNFFGNNRNVWSYNITVDDIAYKNAFRSPDAFNEFVSGMITEHRNTIESGLEAYRRSVVLNYMAGIYDMNDSGLMPGSVINLTETFNDKYGTEYTTADLLSTYFDDLLAHFVETVRTVSRRLENRSSLYHWTPESLDAAGNARRLLRHTSRDNQKMIVYEPFMISAKASVMPKIFNPEFLSLENYEGVDFWQFEDPTLAPTINVTPTIPDGEGSQEKGDAVVLPYVLACIFDKDACMYNAELDRSETTPLDARRLMRNIWLHICRSSVNDFTEKGVLIIMKDPET